MDMEKLACPHHGLNTLSKTGILHARVNRKYHPNHLAMDGRPLLADADLLLVHFHFKGLVSKAVEELPRQGNYQSATTTFL